MRIIAGSYKGRTLKTTTGPGFRPAMGKVREALFSMLEANSTIWPETRVLDLFAGSGSLGFEALSRGAAHVCFVDSATYAAKVIAANADMLDVEEQRYSILCKGAAKVVSVRPVAPYNLVFIDPPYRDKVLAHVLKGIIANGWLAEGALVNAEIEAAQPFKLDTVDERLHLVTDRAYGQTRVLIWEANLL